MLYAAIGGVLLLKKKVQIQNESIESQVNKGFTDALVEYILNGFEANATEISIILETNDLGGLIGVEIKDNGSGINHETISTTFESFLVSSKVASEKPINIGKNKGKGRYSFIGFANSATWKTVYRDRGRLSSYNIQINTSTKDHVFYDETPVDVTESATSTGTTVSFDVSSGLIADVAQIENVLQEAFAYFLYLKKAHGYKIILDNMELDYLKYVDTELTEDKILEIDGEVFNVFFIKWIEAIKSKFFFYLLDSGAKEKYSEHTKFNNNAIDFYHSVYVESGYFNDFVPLHDKINGQKVPENQIIRDEHETKNQRSSTYKKLRKALNSFVEDKQKAIC